MFYDNFNTLEWRVFLRLLMTANKDGKVPLEVNPSKLAKSVGRYRTRGGTLHRTTAEIVVRVLNKFADQGIIYGKAESDDHRRFRSPIVIDPEHYVLSRHASTEVIQSLRDKIANYQEKAALMKEKNRIANQTIRDLRPFKHKYTEIMASEENALEVLADVDEKKEPLKIILAFLVVIGIDKFFYDSKPNGEDDPKMVPTYSLFAKWIADAGFLTVVAVLKELVPHDVELKLSRNYDDWEEMPWNKKTNIFRSYVSGAIKKGQKRGLKSNKRYGRQEAGGDGDVEKQAFE